MGSERCNRTTAMVALTRCQISSSILYAFSLARISNTYNIVKKFFLHVTTCVTQTCRDRTSYAFQVIFRRQSFVKCFSSLIVEEKYTILPKTKVYPYKIIKLFYRNMTTIFLHEVNKLYVNLNLQISTVKPRFNISDCQN